MPKKQFMNKKTALRFEVVSRSLADATYVAGEGSEHILRPMNEAAAEAQFAAMARSQTARENAAAGGVQESKSGDAQEVGGLDDILGMAGVLPPTDVIIDASGQVTEVNPAVEMPGDVFASGEELGPAMEHVSLAPNQVPEDVMAMLEGDVETDEEGDMPDDFVAMLGGVVEEPTPAAEEGGDDFDLEAHMARLIAQAELEDADRFGSDGEFDDDEYAQLAKAAKAAKAKRDDGPKTIEDMRLDAVLHEYDSDEIGELESGGEGEENEVTADMLEGALGEFFAQRAEAKDSIKLLTEGAMPAYIPERKPKSTAGAGAGESKGAEAGDGAAGDAAGGEGEDDASSDSETEIMELPLPAAFQRAHAHDVETIVSTYTTTDNHPTLIDDAPATVIKLSAKTGMPVITTRRKPKKSRAKATNAEADAGAGGGSSDGEDDGASVATSVAPTRRKGETKEEKRARKAAIKEQRRARREAKKANKLTFKEEMKLQKKRSQAGDGQTVFFM